MERKKSEKHLGKKPGGAGGDLKVVTTQAIILADSFDTKFTPISLELPRTLVPVVGIPLLEYTLEFIASANINDIIIFSSTKAELIREYIERSKWGKGGAGVKVTCYSMKKCHSAGVALREIENRQIITGEFVLINGDVVSNMNIKKVIEEHRERREKDKNAIMTSVFKQSNSSAGRRARKMQPTTVAINPTTQQLLLFDNTKDNKKLEIDPEIFVANPKIQFRGDLIDCSIDVCSPEVLYLFKDNPDWNNMRGDFIKGTISEKDVHNYKIFIHTITSEYANRARDLRHYSLMTQEIVNRWSYPMVPDSNILGDTSFHLFRGNIYFEKKVSLHRAANVTESSAVGEGSFASCNSLISKSVIGRNCKIGAHVAVTNSYIWDNVTVEEGAKISNSIICSGAHIGRDTIIAKGSIISFNVIVGPKQKIEGKRITLMQGIDPDDADAEPKTQKIDLGEGGKGFLWLPGSQNPAEDLYDDPSKPPEKEEEDDDLEKEIFVDEEEAGDDSDEEVYSNPMELLRRDVQDTIFSNVDINPANIPNLATELRTRIHAHNVKLNLEVADLAPAILWAVLELAAQDVDPVKDLKKFKTQVIKQLSKWSKLMKIFIGDSEENQKNLLKSLREFWEKEQDAELTRYNGIYSIILDQLYSAEEVEEESLRAWAEAEGKTDRGKAFMKLCQAFFTWLDEAEEEDDE